MNSQVGKVTATSGGKEMEAHIEMYSRWIQMEHYRLHRIENLPESLYKQTTLAAIHATLVSLSSLPLAKSLPLACAVCLERKRQPSVVEFPLRPQIAESQASLVA